jgi:hypothetical protein
MSHLSLALITSRLLASTTDIDISGRAYGLLREARNVTYQWACELGKKVDSTEDENSRAGLQHRLCMLAATCFSTFDVCSEHVPATLASDEDFSIAIHCAVIVQNNTPQSLSNDNSFHLTRMLSRHRRLLHDLKPIFSRPSSGVPGQPTLLHAGAYDQALKRLWPGYHPSRHISSNWHVLPRPNSRWIFCVAESGHEVHYDLLTGKLFISGEPSGRLPHEIVKHPTYISVLDAVSR